MEKDITYYMNLPYKTTIIPDPYGGFVARVEELRGCVTQGETEEEALKNIKEAKELWLETAIKRGIKIPEPVLEEYSGKFVLRIPKSLHKEIAKSAKKEGISINQYLNYLISTNHVHNQYKTHDKKREANITNVLQYLVGTIFQQSEEKKLLWPHDKTSLKEINWEETNKKSIKTGWS